MAYIAPSVHVISLYLGPCLKRPGVAPDISIAEGGYHQVDGKVKGVTRD